MIEQWQRLEMLIGSENLEKLQSKKVLIVGLGGVGGYVAEGLIRSGVYNMTFVDFDSLESSNLNRQIIALHSTLGREKVSLMKERCLDINPSACIESKVLFLDDKTIDDIFMHSYDYVVDACDTIHTKELLIDRCLSKHIPIISCMGTARRMNPNHLEIVDIFETAYDPLAKIIRKYMREKFPGQKLSVLSSSEVPKKMENTLLASNIFVPATAGLLIAHFVVSELMK